MPSPPPHRRVVPRKKADLDELDLTAKRSAAPKGDFDPDDVEMTAERVKLDAGDSVEMTVQRPKVERESVPHTRPTPIPFADGTDDAPAAPPRRKLDVRLPDPPKRGEVKPRPTPAPSAHAGPSAHGSNVLPRAHAASGIHATPQRSAALIVDDEDDDELIYVDNADTPPSFPPVHEESPALAASPSRGTRQSPNPSRQTPVPGRPENDPHFRPTRQTPVPRRPVDTPDTGVVARRADTPPEAMTGVVPTRRPAQTPDTGLVAARPMIRTAHDSPTVVGAPALPDPPDPPRRRSDDRTPVPVHPAYEDSLESPWSGDQNVDQRRSASQPKAAPRRSSQRFAAADPRTPSGRRAATPNPDSKRHPRVDPVDESHGHRRVDESRKSQPRLDAANKRETRSRTPVFGSNVVKDEPGSKPQAYKFDPKSPLRGVPLSAPIGRPDPGRAATDPPDPPDPHDDDDFAYEEPVAPSIAAPPVSEAEWDLPPEPSPGDTFEMEVASFSDVEPTGIAAGPPVEIEDRPITNLDPGERGLLAAIAAGSESSRAKYADWLSRHGEAARAEYMRAEQDLHKILPNDPQRPVAYARLAAVAPRISMDWRSLVARSPIEGCSAAGACPGLWSSLSATDGDDHRVCAVCTHPVFYCASLELAQKRRANGEYVAVDVLVERHPGDLDTGSMQCLNCGTPVPSDARFCPNCGQSIQQVFQMGGF